MTWNSQTNNMGNSVKLVVFYHDGLSKISDTFHAFKGEEEKGTAIAGLTRRILQGKVNGMYKTAIFYKNGVEVERWNNGYRNT